MRHEARSPLPSDDLPGANAPIFKLLQNRRAADARPDALVWTQEQGCTTLLELLLRCRAHDEVWHMTAALGMTVEASPGEAGRSGALRIRERGGRVVAEAWLGL